MATPKATWSFSAYLQQVQQMRRVWEAAGFRLSNSRLAQYERDLKLLVELLPDKLTNNLTEEQVRDMILMFVEILEFLFVSSIVPHRPRLMAHPRLKEVFSGAPLSGQENNTLPRNTLFELTVASLLEKAGIATDVISGSDVEASFEVPLCIECKRVQSMAAIEARLIEADRQLATRLPQRGAGALGIIAVSVTKALTAGTKRLQVADDKQIDAVMTQVALETAKELRKHVAKLQSCEVVLLHACIAGTTGTPFVYTQIGFLAKAGLSEERRALINRLQEKLQLVRGTGDAYVQG
jgi:hypothetical protein